MSSRSVPSIPKWPFFIADIILLATAGWLVWKSPAPLEPAMAALVVLCGFAGGWIAIMPFLKEYQAQIKRSEQEGLADTLQQIQQLQEVGKQISIATGQWQTVQEHSARTVNAAQEIAEKMAAEAKGFAEFLQKANDTERQHLRLEVDKLKRGEGEWLQLLVHLLDHIFALHQAGLRSGQPNLVAQLNNFQRACRDVVRRVGLVSISNEPGDPFDEKIHLPHEAATPPAEGSRISEFLAPGYTFQGQLLRKALVRVDGAIVTPTALTDPSPVTTATVTTNLPDEPAKSAGSEPLQPEMF